MSVRMWVQGRSVGVQDTLTAARYLSDILLTGGLVALPTDTVYGIAALAQNAGACERLYRVKGRATVKPVSVCVAEVAEVSQWAHTEHVPPTLLSALLPGPVTVVLPRQSRLNHQLNAGTSLVGVRVPDSDLVRSVARLCGANQPLALTSANVSGEASALCVAEFSSLQSNLDAVADVGLLASERGGSTVVDLSQERHYRVVRDGSALQQTLSILHSHGWCVQ